MRQWGHAVAATSHPPPPPGGPTNRQRRAVQPPPSSPSSALAGHTNRELCWAVIFEVVTLIFDCECLRCRHPD